MAREVGISKIKLFPLVTDEVGMNVVYGQGFNVPWAVNFETSSEYAEGEYYADNIIEHSKKLIAKMGITMEVSSNTPPGLDAKITGKLYDKAQSVTVTGQTAPYYAIAYEILMDDGNIRRRVIYKVSLARNGQTNSTQEDSLTGQTYTYEGTAIPLTANGFLELTMDEKEVTTLGDPGITDKFEKFFDAPVVYQP